MSVFNCHVNRSPVTGRLETYAYVPGTKAAAFADKASTENEQTRITMKTSAGSLTFKQIAGALARRIVFYPHVGDEIPRGARIGLIKFGSHAEQVVEPTTDRGQLRLALNSLKVAGGTAMGDGLKLGLEAAQAPIPDGLGGTRKLPTAIVLLSDGASTRGEDPIDIAQQAKKAKIRVYTVALGTPNGTLETKRADGTTRSEKVPPDTLTLQDIARDTGGRYFNAPDADQLEAVYAGLATRFATVREKQEMTATFAGAGLVLLLGGLAFSLLRGGRLP